MYPGLVFITSHSLSLILSLSQSAETSLKDEETRQLICLVFVLLRNLQQDLKGISCCAKIIQELHKVLLKNQRIVSKETVLNGTRLMFLALDHVADVEEKLCQQNDSVQAHSWRQDAEQVTMCTCSWLSDGFATQRIHAKTLEVCFVLVIYVSHCFKQGEIEIDLLILDRLNCPLFFFSFLVCHVHLAVYAT